MLCTTIADNRTHTHTPMSSSYKWLLV